MQAPPGEQVIGWKLGGDTRGALLARFAPRYANTIADHVTLRSKVDAAAGLPPPVAARIVGRADDGQGVEAMVVEIEGSSARPDGGTYHVTWSLAAGREAKESNDVIAARGWTPIDPPVPLLLEPACFPRTAGAPAGMS